MEGHQVVHLCINTHYVSYLGEMTDIIVSLNIPTINFLCINKEKYHGSTIPIKEKMFLLHFSRLKVETSINSINTSYLTL